MDKLVSGFVKFMTEVEIKMEIGVEKVLNKIDALDTKPAANR